MAANNSRTNPTTAQEAVLAILGSGPAAAGTAVVNLINDQRQEIDAKIAAIAERVRGAEGLASKQKQLSEALVTLSSLVDEKSNEHAEEVAAVRKDVNQLRAIVAAAGRVMAGAMEATNVATQADDLHLANAKINEANNLLDQAEAEQKDCCDKIAELESRVAEIERWRKDVVDPALKAHMESIDNLNSWRKRTVDPLIERLSAPEPKVEQSTFQRRIHPANWGWIAWALATVGGLTALMIALVWFGPAVSGRLSDYPGIFRVPIAFLAGAGLTGVGFFGGGLLGAAIADRLEEDQATDVDQSTQTVTATSS